MMLQSLKSLRFDQPWWLLAAVLAALPILLAVRPRWPRAMRAGRKSSGRSRTAVSLWAAALQATAVLLAAVALAGPAVRVGRKSRLPWLILRDVSASTRGQDSNLVVSGRAGAGGASSGAGWPVDLPYEIAPFADRVLQPGESSASAPARVGEGSLAGDWGGRTLIRPALQLALARAAELAGVVVRSDGQWHDDRWADAAEALRRAGLPVLVAPLDEPPSDARIAEFHASRAAGGKVVFQASLTANAPLARRLTIRREGEDKPLLDKDVRLVPGEGFTARVEDAPLANGADATVTYRATIAPSDSFPQNDAASAVVPPGSRRAAFVMDAAALFSNLGPDPRGGHSILRSSDAPRTLAEWMPFSIVTLDNPAGRLLDAQQRASLEQYVRQGGGLVIVGTGPCASAQDRQDPLNRAAALVPNPYERRPLRLVVVLDSSGSMGEAEGPSGARRKYDLAVEAAVSLRSHLTPRDSLAVIAFSDSARRVYDSGLAQPDYAALREALAKVQPGGPTVVAPALEEATATAAPKGTEGLPSAEPRGLIIVVSDLAAKPFDEAAMAQRFRRQGYALAVIEVQSAQPTPAPVKPSLATLAKLLDAPLVPQQNLAGLADIFGRFIRQARGDVVKKGSFSIAAPGPVFDMDVAKLPPLAGYVLSAPQEGEDEPAGREKAEVLASVGEDPVIARRRVGLGRSVSVAVPVDANLNAALGGSRDFQALLIAAAAWAARVTRDDRFSCDVSLIGGKVRLRVEAVEANASGSTSRPAGGGPMNLLKLTARLARPGEQGPVREVPLEQVAPGRYEADVGEAGEALLIEVVGGGGRTHWLGGWGASYEQEYAGIGPDWANLQRLAALSGGRIVPMASLGATGRELLGEEYTPLAAVLLAAAVAIMLLEWVAVRIVRK